MAKENPASAPSKLPNAPLVEVVFELRWKMLGEPDAMAPLQRDPGYFGCLDALYQKVASIGFRSHKPVEPAPQLVPHAVEHRFYQSDSDSFPVLQIGPGVFAVNHSTGYTWASFKALCLSGVALLLSSYPKMREFPFVPTGLELKYLDAFQSRPSGSKDLIHFLNESTNLKLELPAFLRSDSFGSIDEAQLNLVLPLKESRDSRFAITISKRTISGVQSWLMETIYRTGSGTILQGAPSLAKASLGKWLEGAHGIASPFFRSFVKESLMAEYKEKVSA